MSAILNMYTQYMESVSLPILVFRIQKKFEHTKTSDQSTYTPKQDTISDYIATGVHNLPMGLIYKLEGCKHQQLTLSQVLSDVFVEHIVDTKDRKITPVSARLESITIAILPV